MADGAEWVEDVRRWYLAGRQPSASTATQDAVTGDEGDPLGSEPEGNPIGYEAADPALQARYWPDAPTADTAAPARIRS